MTRTTKGEEALRRTTAAATAAVLPFLSLASHNEVDGRFHWPDFWQGFGEFAGYLQIYESA